MVPATGAEAGDRSDAARAEATRLEARLAVARDRLDALLPPEAPDLLESPRPDAPQLPHPLTSVSSDADISGADCTEVSGCGAPRGGAAPRDCAAPREGVARFDDDNNDDELREFLRPAAARIARLVELAGSFAAGTLTDESAAAAARTISDEQPFRRSR